MQSGEKCVPDQIQDLLKQINTNLGHALSKEMDSLSPLTLHQVYILKVINQKIGVNLTSLCNDLGQTKGAMSLTINKLVEDGYVLRKEDEKDRRNVGIFLSTKGQSALHEASKRLRQCFNFLTSSLSEKELEQIKKKLKKLNTAIIEAMQK